MVNDSHELERLQKTSVGTLTESENRTIKLTTVRNVLTRGITEAKKPFPSIVELEHLIKRARDLIDEVNV